MKNTERATLTTTNLEKLRVNAVKGMEEKFDLTDPIETVAETGIEVMKHNVDVTTLIEASQKHCQRYGMDEVFQLVLPNDDQVANPGQIQENRTVDLFENYSASSDAIYQRICLSTRFYRTYGQEYDLQNLDWSESFFSNCCTPELRTKINEKMKLTDDLYHGGPLYFFEMIRTILALSEDGASALKDQIKNLKMQSFKGENVPRAVTLLRGSYRRLNLIGDVPLDVPHQLIKIFETCLVSEFSSTFSTIKSLHYLRKTQAGGHEYSVEDILSTAEASYLSLGSIWNVPKDFKGATINSSSIKCWGCGRRGHGLHDCPHLTDGKKA